MKTVVSYLRVSTDRQGRNGPGIEAQRDAIAGFAETEGYIIAAEHVEVETGKGADALDRRPELAAALAAAPQVAVPGDRGEARPPVPRCGVHLGADGAEGTVHRR